MDSSGDNQDWYWIDDNVTARELEVHQLPVVRCIQVSASGSDTLKRLPGQLIRAITSGLDGGSTGANKIPSPASTVT